jgi:lipopolysaccharide biosynthesis regulator YciM
VKAIEKITMLHQKTQAYKVTIARKYVKMTWQDRHALIAKYRAEYDESIKYVSDVVHILAKRAAIEEMEAMGICLR